MDTIKRVIIFLLVAVGVFATVEFVSNINEANTNWGVSPTVLASNGKPLIQTATIKASNVQAGRKNKAPAL